MYLNVTPKKYQDFRDVQRVLHVLGSDVHSQISAVLWRCVALTFYLSQFGEGKHVARHEKRDEMVKSASEELLPLSIDPKWWYTAYQAYESSFFNAIDAQHLFFTLSFSRRNPARTV